MTPSTPPNTRSASSPSPWRFSESVGPSASDATLAREWLITDGLGGFGLGTLCGRPDRRYHGWFVPALSPPVGRVVALHSIAEWLVLESPDGALRRLGLSTFAFEGGAILPDVPLTAFHRDDVASATWVFHDVALGIRLSRTLRLLRHARAAVVRYDVAIDDPSPYAAVRLELRPFTPLRDMHELASRETDGIYTAARSTVGAGVPRVEVRRGGLCLNLEVGDADASTGRGFTPPRVAFAPERQWWNAFRYARDIDRGQGGVEDLFSPGVFILEPGEGPIELRVWLGDEPCPQGDAIAASTKADLSRLDRALDHALTGVTTTPQERADVARLIIAADQFIVTRHVAMAGGEQQRLSSTIAGYPWFADWGRDACISVPGLALVTGRFDEAFDALRAMALHRRRGLIPNCFDDTTGVAQYNAADAPLWFILSAVQAVRVSSRRDAFEGVIRSTCLEIVDAYRRGTDFGVAVDPADGLVRAGSPSTQLTWMDAARDGVIFTPRHGKPVELSALWYAAVLELAWAIEPDQPRTARELAQLADITGRHFEPAFWNPSRQCLFDRLVDAGAGRWVGVNELRPNQIFAASLPASPLSPPVARAMLETVGRELLTPQGLRTLSPNDAGYRPRYEGNLFLRDGAYHNGTVWPWLLGPYVEALLRVHDFSDAARREALDVLAPLVTGRGKADDEADAIRAPSISQIAEVYDADAPRRPDGCPAQAWSVAELLRAFLLAKRSHPSPSSTKR